MKRIIIVLSIIISTGFVCFEQGLPKSVWKKVNKEIQFLWPEKVVDKEILFDDALKVYNLTSDSDIVGFLLLGKAPSRYDNFDYMLIYSPELTIKSAKILVYRESYGGEIGSKRWLKQFLGYSSEDGFALGEDIQGISGATISCQAATKGFRDATITMNKLKIDGVL